MYTRKLSCFYSIFYHFYQSHQFLCSKSFDYSFQILAIYYIKSKLILIIRPCRKYIGERNKLITNTLKHTFFQYQNLYLIKYNYGQFLCCSAPVRCSSVRKTTFPNLCMNNLILRLAYQRINYIAMITHLGPLLPPQPNHMFLDHRKQFLPEIFLPNSHQLVF